MRWAGTEPADYPDPDLDDLTRAELAECDERAAVTAKVLDDWLHQQHGIMSSHHGVGLFLDLLAAEGYRVEPIDQGLPLGQMLPPPTE